MKGIADDEEKKYRDPDKHLFGFQISLKFYLGTKRATICCSDDGYDSLVNVVLRYMYIGEWGTRS